MRQDAPVRHRLLLALAVVGIASTAACSGDQAQISQAGAPQITAEVGQLRVLSYDDDPATDDWLDVVTPDPAVFEEGDSFREADSRAAGDDQAAEDRRLFTGLTAGRTLLVQLDQIDDDVLVWDLAVGAPDQEFSDGREFSDGTTIAAPGRPLAVEVGDHFAVVRGGADGPADAEFTTDGAPPVELVGRHVPDDGADLFVDVYVARSAGQVDIVYGGSVVPVDIG